MFSLIVFSERCKLQIKNTSNSYVFKREQILDVISKIWKQSKDALSSAEIDKTNADLNKYKITSDEAKKEHIKRIEQRKRICPNCGAKLIIRTAKRGYNIGHKFYGCSNYPNCKYTKSI